MNPLISIIVPVYKVEDYLDQCVKSLVGQTYRELEIILVDDGSTDLCPGKCDMWAESDERIKVIHKSNGGLSDARNAGINIAHGDFIVFVDSDDWVEKDMVDVMLQAAIEVDADICACGIQYDYENHYSKLSTPRFVGNSCETLERLYQDTLYPVAAWNKLYKRECWNTLRFPVGKLCEDAFTTYLLIDAAKRIVQIPNVLYHYRIRENSIMTSRFTHKKMDEEEAWRNNYCFIAEKYPQLERTAKNFYLERVNRLIHTIPSDQKEFSDDFDFLRDILKRNMTYLLFESKMSFKKRISMLLDYIKL